MKSARVWPFSSFASTSSSTDSTALVMNRQPVSRQHRQQLAMLQEMLDLDDRVVGERRELAMQRLDDPPRVRRAVEEVRIAKRDVRGALLPPARGCRRGRRRPGRRETDRRRRARSGNAGSDACSRASRRSRHTILLRAVRHLQRRITIERRQPGAIGLDEVEPSRSSVPRCRRGAAVLRCADLRCRSTRSSSASGPARSRRRAAAAAHRSAAHTDRRRNRRRGIERAHAIDHRHAPAASPYASADRTQ